MDREAWQSTHSPQGHKESDMTEWLSLTPLQIEKLTSCDWTRRSQVFLPKGSYRWGFPGGSNGKEPACNVGDLGSVPERGRSPGEGHDNPLQYFRLENPRDRGAWWTTIHGATKSRTWLSNTHRHTRTHTHTHTHTLIILGFPSGPVVKSLLTNAVGTGSIPGKIPWRRQW